MADMIIFCGQKAVRLFAVAVVTLGVSGCFGIGFVHSKEVKYDKFSVSVTNDEKWISGRGADTSNPNKEQLKALWGEPNAIIRKKDTEIWRYHDGMIWYGVVPMVGIGIPLVLPLERSKRDIYFHEDVAQFATVDSTTWSGFCYCPNNEGQMKYGFYRLTD